MDLITVETKDIVEVVDRILDGKLLATTVLTENGSAIGVEIESSNGLVRFSYANYSFKVFTTPEPELIPCLIAAVYYKGKLRAESDLVGKTPDMSTHVFDNTMGYCVEALLEPFDAPYEFNAQHFAREAREWFEDNPEEVSHILEYENWALVIKYEQVDAKEYALAQELRPEKKSRF